MRPRREGIPWPHGCRRIKSCKENAVCMLDDCKWQGRDIRPAIEARYAVPVATYRPPVEGETGRECFERMISMRKPGISLVRYTPDPSRYQSGYVEAAWWAFRAGTLWSARGGQTLD